jgi:hypothetical protein
MKNEEDSRLENWAVFLIDYSASFIQAALFSSLLTPAVAGAGAWRAVRGTS